MRNGEREWVEIEEMRIGLCLSKGNWRGTWGRLSSWSDKARGLKNRGWRKGGIWRYERDLEWRIVEMCSGIGF
jgi:hypothetical protein